VRKKLIIGTGSITLVLVLVLVLVVGAGVQANSEEFSPIVSTDWLAGHLDDVVILDVRNPDEYLAGHIPGAINSPEWMWYVSYPLVDPPPWLELPAVEDIFANIEAAGITGDSLVVIISRTVDSAAGPAVFALAGATRVAVTLIYAGVENVAILNGGWDLWLAEGKATTLEVPEIMSSEYTADVNEAMFVSMDYVQERIGRILRSKIVDSRDADVYFGVTLEELWTEYPGHIPSAKSLPVPWLWTFIDGIGTYKATDVLEDMATGVVGRQVCGWWGYFPREIIVYCGVGGYASTNYFVLSEVLGYENVKIYDGSAQEWTLAGYPVNLYEWE
jgi:thiosulfate/3-mercaptopyruvate sulfurtransferase